MHAWRHVRWALLAAIGVGLAFAPLGSANHLGNLELGHEHTGVTSMTSIRAIANEPAFYATNEWGNGIASISNAPVGVGVYGIHQATSGTAAGVRGDTYATTPSSGVEGNGLGGGGRGVYGFGTAYGVYGESRFTGVYGTAAWGVRGIGSRPSPPFAGNVYGVWGQTESTVPGDAGVYGQASAPAFAGYFVGNVNVTGTLTKGGGAFRIDHPLDPARRYLQHSFVESPDMKNVYDGVVTTDRNGFATVRLPRYFQALNRDFRYQLTPIGRDAWDARAGIWQEIRANRFVIRSEPNTKVSWHVTGIRKDRYANAHRIKVEVEKPVRDQGTYLHPELYGKP